MTERVDERPAAAGTSPPVPRNSSSSVRRALAVLDHLGEQAADPRGASLGDLAHDLGIPKSTLLRLLRPLRDTGLVQTDSETGRYRLGPRTARLGHLYLERLDLRTLARDVLRRLLGECWETVHLVVPDASDPSAGPAVVYVDKVESPHAVRMHSRIGARQPAYCTAVGKAFLAYAPPEATEAAIAAGMPSRTPATLTTGESLRAALAQVRRQGYAVDDVENEPDIRCVAAPVLDHTDMPVGAISASGPTTRVTASRVDALGGLVRIAAAEVSARLGWRSPPPGEAR
ncbi:MAG: IclR family transcriptional regulator [Actinomycetes bacterium]